MQSGYAQIEEVGGHAAEDQKQIRTPNKWINHLGSVQDKDLQSRLINTAFHLLVRSNKRGGESGDLLEGGSLTEDFQKFSQSLLWRAELA